MFRGCFFTFFHEKHPRYIPAVDTIKLASEIPASQIRTVAITFPEAAIVVANVARAIIKGTFLIISNSMVVTTVMILLAMVIILLMLIIEPRKTIGALFR